MGRSRLRLTHPGVRQGSRFDRKFATDRGLAHRLAVGLSMALSLALSSGLLAGCATGVVVDDLPSAVGLPADAPARPKVAYQYPAVHDMPPPRAVPPLSDAAQVRLEKELLTDRDRLEGKPISTKKPGSAKKPAAEVNNQPLNIKSDQGSGAATKP